jgi:uncharacterized protein YecA (UPF0149 family)
MGEIPLQPHEIRIVPAQDTTREAVPTKMESFGTMQMVTDDRFKRLSSTKAYPGYRRNHPCPCGSGKKSKLCCSR